MTSKEKRNLGIFLLILPFGLLILALIGYAILQFLVLGAIEGGDAAMVAVFNFANMILGLIGVLGVGGFFVFWPLGIVFITLSTKKDSKKTVQRIKK